MENPTKPEDGAEEETDSEPYMILPDANSSSMHLVLEGSDAEKEAMTNKEDSKENENDVIQTSQCCLLL